MATFMSWLDLCLACAGVYLIKRIVSKKNLAPFPPGPKPLPLFGNLLDKPSVKQWLTFSDWANKFGDMIHLEIFGQHTVILNSANAAVEMLEKKSSIYSDRPTLPMGGELIGWKDALVLLPYGDKFREHRRNFHRVLGGRTAVSVYHPIEEMETHKTAGAIILRISYGYCIREGGDPFVDLAGKVIDDFARYTAVGAFMVDSIPALAYVPEWFPGAGFKRKARECHADLLNMINQLFELAKKQMAAGIACKSLTSDLLERKASTEEEHDIKWTAGMMLAGGADTGKQTNVPQTVSSNYAFFLAMTLYPEVQRKAQAEIDAVIGSDRLPTFADRESLPYVEALVKEVYRWHAVVPVVLPHRLTVDDIHNGYYIPRGTLMTIDTVMRYSHLYRGMLHDPSIYPNPMEFNPNRFLPGEASVLVSIVPARSLLLDGLVNGFNIYQQVCTFADASVWLTVAMSLAVFEISKVVENGVEITPEVDPSSGTISHPKLFKCSIKARSAKALELIQQNPRH
ncbi:cytochrome P450 [Pisolithus orientalis]|uniref:cytochrome P450 n=1 Tax=Pisolithus orientalis TaxID=936130 RepID=UPI0022242154|nr:cytochrome P450 [Pisolithus orientalis]KAI5994900.1 cytochrome P450 [Pisolithus orientalis]